MRTFTITIFSFLLLISTSAFAQQNGLNVTTEPKIIGKNYIDNSDIKCVEYVFPNKINDIFLDSENNFATVQLEKKRNKGTIYQYDLNNRAILWNKSFDYQINELLKFDNLLVFNEYNDSYGLDPST